MSESSAAAAAVAAASDSAAESSPKRVKSQPPDVGVAVGRGEAQVEFECYGTLLSFASEVFDTMLSTNMKEKDTGRIELPDKDPEEWKMFYEFIEDRHAKVENSSGPETKTRVRILLPWFHEFQMTALVKECDEVLRKEPRLSYNKEKRKEDFQLCHELLSMSYVYDLPRTQKSASESLSFIIRDGYDLFDLDSIKNIIPLLKSNEMLLRAIKEFIPDQIFKDAKQCDRLLWARITQPVQGTIPTSGQDQDRFQDHVQDQNQDQDRRLAGRLWPCLFYHGGCAEILKDIAATSGKAWASAKLKSNLDQIPRYHRDVPVILPLGLHFIDKVDHRSGVVTAAQFVAAVPDAKAQDWHAGEATLGADGLRGFDSEADRERCRRHGYDAVGKDRAVFDAACAMASQTSGSKSLMDNDLLPFLIHAGMRSKHDIKKAKRESYKAKKALSHVKKELQIAVNDLPSCLEGKLPNARRMPAPGTEKIDAKARRELEKLMHNRWRRQGYVSELGGPDDESSREAVRAMIQVPPSYSNRN